MDPGQMVMQAGFIWLPRASGDGPTCEARTGSSMKAAPRERGWTLTVDQSRSAAAGCPARAGMDPNRAAALRRARRLPRASGDGPACPRAGGSTCLAAPRERGWTLLGRAVRLISPGCPARAGMDPGRTHRAEYRRWLPRASGDGPLSGKSAIGLPGAAPRERGWTPDRPNPGAVFRGCPARAGMDPKNGMSAHDRPWLPRASGDGPHSAYGNTITARAAPRERGWTLCPIVTRASPSGCPARAGMDPRTTGTTHHSGWLPRASGDGPNLQPADATEWEAAPRERGWTRPSETMGGASIGCPARAGMDPRQIPPSP